MSNYDVVKLVYDDEKREKFFSDIGKRKSQKKAALEIVKERKKREKKRKKKNKRNRRLKQFDDLIDNSFANRTEEHKSKIIEKQYNGITENKDNDGSEEKKTGGSYKVVIEPLNIGNEIFMNEWQNKRDLKKEEEEEEKRKRKDDKDDEEEVIVPEYLKKIPGIFMLKQDEIDAVQGKKRRRRFGDENNGRKRGKAVLKINQNARKYKGKKRSSKERGGKKRNDKKRKRGFGSKGNKRKRRKKT